MAVVDHNHAHVIHGNAKRGYDFLRASAFIKKTGGLFLKAAIPEIGKEFNRDIHRMINTSLGLKRRLLKMNRKDLTGFYSLSGLMNRYKKRLKIPEGINFLIRNIPDHVMRGNGFLAKEFR
jgi:hypothetical protein